MKLTIQQMAQASPMPMFVRDLRESIRRGDKTQTRRIINPQPRLWDGEWGWSPSKKFMDQSDELRVNPTSTTVTLKGRPFGDASMMQYAPMKVGDIRYLREPIIRGESTSVLGRPYHVANYEDDGKVVNRRTKHPALLDAISWRWKAKKLSQMLMPREMARTFLVVDDVRVQRVREISEADARAEGVAVFNKEVELWQKMSCRDQFKWVWDTINGKRGHGWAKNEWVWAYTFRLVWLNGREVE